jgi:hypothetical protein
MDGGRIDASISSLYVIAISDSFLFCYLFSIYEGSVGKTSLVTRYVQNTFNERHVTTIQASFLTKRLNVDGSRVNISIWVMNAGLPFAPQIC